MCHWKKKKQTILPDAQSTPNTATICPACASWMSFIKQIHKTERLWKGNNKINVIWKGDTTDKI